MKKELFQKYLNNGCSEKEFEEFVTWIKEEAHKKQGSNWAFDVWESLKPELEQSDKKRYDAILDKIHHEINLKENVKKKGKVISMTVLSAWVGRVAAILIIPVLTFLLYTLSTNNFQFNQISNNAVDTLEVIAPVGSRTVVQLTDGTKVNLNYGSSIKYPKNFNSKNREVTLKGEGFFDVEHNPKKPFIVKTEKINVQVLGTEFNVQAYPDDNEVSTTLVSGKVLLEEVLHNENIKNLGTMVPGQHVAYNKETGKLKSTKGKVAKYISWKEGKQVFDNEPITEVAERLSRMFNVEIELDENVKGYTYTVTFEDDPLTLILDLMCKTTPITYIVYPRKKQIDGTFTKQKIEIKAKI